MTIAKQDRLPLTLLGLLTLICLATGYAPAAGRLSWALEVVPGLLGIAALIVSYKRMRMSDLVYVGSFVHMLVLIYGGFYTYANTPLGNWARDAFHLSRNHYDRVGHFALGFFPAIVIRELLLRASPLRVVRRDPSAGSGWLFFIVLSIAFAIGAFWELVEWWTTLVVAGDVGTAFLGSQGDVWDAQEDMLFVGIGAAVALIAMKRLHDRSMDACEAAKSL